MPTYEFICNACQEQFERYMTLQEHGEAQEKHETKCPKCGSENVDQQIETFFAVTSKKS